MPAYSLLKPPHVLFRDCFKGIQNASLLFPNKLVSFEKLARRCFCSAPIHFQRKTTRLVSYYAFMIEWLLPSQPPSCQRCLTSFPTHRKLRDLSGQAGLFPFRLSTLALKVCLHRTTQYGIRSFPESSKALGPHSSISALPPLCFTIRCTSIHFAKNQLCLSLIGLSPLASTHPRLLLQTSVRSSKRHYAFFNLVKARSLSFGSNEPNIYMHIGYLLLLCFHISA